VLAGGQSRRLGRDKAVEPVGGQPLIRRVLDRLSRVCDELVVVVSDQARGDALPLGPGHRVALDRYPGGGSLGGIFAGLATMRQDWGLVVACDMPFLNLDLLRYLRSQRPGYDAVVPVLAGRPEPTHALYSRDCLPFIEDKLKVGSLKISGFYDRVRVNYVPEAAVARLDPEYLSFFNVNSPEDLARALSLVAASR
jgi:molybdopterin-guanine dinucleotide biosynthesis protein A